MYLRRAIGFMMTSLAVIAVVIAVKPSRSADAPQTMAPMPTAAPVDSFVAERDSLMNQVLNAIAGREGAPAESVFKNIKILKGMPAGRVPRIMNMGFGKSLGVGCRHCHVPGHWADDDKPQKQIARDMWDMVGTINRQMLPGIKNLRTTQPQPAINCTSCHRGAIKPALNL